jgi:hypothetical protein
MVSVHQLLSGGREFGAKLIHIRRIKNPRGSGVKIGCLIRGRVLLDLVGPIGLADHRGPVIPTDEEQIALLVKLAVREDSRRE